MTHSLYSAEFKESALRKVFQRKGQTIDTIANELNVRTGTLKNWMKMAQPSEKTAAISPQRPDDWTLEARLNALHQTYALAEPELSAWCRQHGIFAHHLTQWRTEFCLSNKEKVSSHAQEIRALKQSKHQLERELTRKEKALAEAAALLILQKKFQALWEDEAT